MTTRAGPIQQYMALALQPVMVGAHTRADITRNLDHIAELAFAAKNVTEIGRIGCLICMEGSFPETARGLAMNGAEIIYRPSYPEPYAANGLWEVQNRARALDNTVYVVAPNPASYAPSAESKFPLDMFGGPSMFQPLTRVFSAYLSDGLLDPEIREIAILRVGHVCNSAYEVVNHVRVARLIGMSEERIAALAPGGNQSLFTPPEQAVLTFVDEVVKEGGASRSAFDAVAKFLPPAEMIELTVVIGIYMMVSQICATFEIEPEDTPIADTGIEDIKRTGQFCP